MPGHGQTRINTSHGKTRTNTDRHEPRKDTDNTDRSDPGSRTSDPGPPLSARERNERVQLDAILRSTALSVVKVVEPDALDSERHAKERRRRMAT